jgi:hypothetical protein
MNETQDIVSSLKEKGQFEYHEGLFILMHECELLLPSKVLQFIDGPYVS